MNIEIVTQIAIAIGIVIGFRILSAGIASLIIKILTSKKFGIPIMILFLGIIFWLTAILTV